VCRIEIEVLCTLIRSSGVCIDLPEHKSHMDDYFARIKLLSENKSLSPRIRFKLEVCNGVYEMLGAHVLMLLLLVLLLLLVCRHSFIGLN
jgi:hypothetical protein